MFAKGGMGQLMKQAQQMQQAQQQINETIVTGEAGAGLVKITLSGDHRCHGVIIDESLMKDDKEILEDLIIAALNDARRHIETLQKQQLGVVTGNMPLPPGLKLPF